MSLVVTVTTCTPDCGGGKYRPVTMIMPVDGVPPTTPSTDHINEAVPAPRAENCCLSPEVNTVVRGLMVNSAPTPDRATMCGAPAAVSAIMTSALRLPAPAG